ncbi:MAG TPA: efflux RND transporter periplasmic adaptor subunit [Steroidobacteraceae bacterium]|nr:efflux RND transporter periplasmic adaptor subunit [Steroidobacteraceae bacterium]
MKARTVLITAGLIAAAVGVSFWIARPEPIAVEVTAAERGSVAETVTNTRAGTLEACRRARMAPPSAGQIARLPVREGDRVKEGEILLELWNEDLRSQLDLAMRDVVAARARAEEACVSARVARRESDRLAAVLERGLVSIDAAERADGEAEAREAACRAAQQSVSVAEARVDAARAAIERTRLRAPFEGIVAELNGKVGEFVTPSPVGIPTPPAVDLVDTGCLYVTAPIDEVDAPRIREGMPARVTLDAFRGRTFPARVRRVAPYVLDIEKQARTVEVEAEIQIPEDVALLPGYSADLEVILDERDDVLRVPTRALIEGDNVYVLAETGLLDRRELETGLRNWEWTEVRSGIEAGDLVVLSVDREGLADDVPARPE